MFLARVPYFLGDTLQEWNRAYRSAQTIFDAGPTSAAVRSSIQAGHRMLYARSVNNGFGRKVGRDTRLTDRPSGRRILEIAAPGHTNQTTQPIYPQPSTTEFIVSTTFEV